MNERKFWTNEEKQYLYNNYLTVDVYELATYFNTTIDKVRQMAHKIGASKCSFHHWTEEEDNIIRQFDGEINVNWDELSKLVNHSISATKARFNKIGCKNGRRWTNEEVEFLKENYAEMPMRDLRKVLNHPTASIQDKAYDLGIRRNTQGQINTRKFENIFIPEGNILKMYTADQKYYAIVDKEDFNKIKNLYWRMNINGYFTHDYKEGTKQCHIWLHRYVLDEIDNNMVVDHINRKRWDARKENLRIVSIKENASNRNDGTGLLEIQPGIWRYIYKKKVMFEGSYKECIEIKNTIQKEKGAHIQTEEDIMKHILNDISILNDANKKSVLASAIQLIGNI